MNKKKFILCGPAASGKDFLKQKFRELGFKLDVSYTTRSMRDGEEEGRDYCFLERPFFIKMQKENAFYEYAEHGGHLYGTGRWEWNNNDIFIMETDGIKALTPADRKNCFIIFINPSEEIRTERLRSQRGWSEETIKHRLKTDKAKFDNFVDYDIVITNPEFVNIR